MKFFFPDAQDLVDPTFDFDTERRSSSRLRQRDDVYAHEVFAQPPYDGLLVSKGIVDGVGGSGGRYTLAQRHRLLRVGAREFLRLESNAPTDLPVMGDCGAFTYVREKSPPFSVDDVLAFYSDCGFSIGASVDHVILSYQPSWDIPGAIAPEDVRERQQITLSLASEFLAKHRNSRLSFEPMGVAQGWSPKSYARAVQDLQKMGYGYIALGGMVPLKTVDIIASLVAIADVRSTNTRLHLFGVTRADSIATFGNHGVVSFDSTSPLRQAFKDDKDNYYSSERAYTAVRVPQVQGHPGLQRAIRAGTVKQQEARRLELQCLELMRRFDANACSLETVLRTLREYGELYHPGRDQTPAYAETLGDRPWTRCPCDICKSIGYHVILFRGAERNRRRGFHNLSVFYERLCQEPAQSEFEAPPILRVSGASASH